MTYDKDIKELRRKIDRIDSEIFNNILTLSKVINIYRQCSALDYDWFSELSNIEKLANEKNLDSKRISKIFEEIRNLIRTQELN